jgi:uncharacterized protein (DUF427 family)
VSKDIKIPSADHPITVEADTARVLARVGDTVIADTHSALTLREAGYQPVYYVPLDDVVPGALRPSSLETYCPYKGDASYYDIILRDGQVLSDAVWSYRTPYPAVDAIAGHVAFYTDRVQVEAEQ